MIQVLGFLYTIWPRPEPVLVPKEDPSQHPIFVLVPTVNEGTEILQATLAGAISARTQYLDAFPRATVTIVVCNDGRVANAPCWQDVEQLAERLGVVCVTRTVGGGAKAGNIEFARQQVGATNNALMVIALTACVATKLAMVCVWRARLKKQAAKPDNVRLQNRATLARMSSAVLVQMKGFTLMIQLRPTSLIIRQEMSGN